MSRGLSAASVALAVTAALFAGVSGVPAQEAPGLERVDSLIAEGRIATARRTLQEWWDGGRSEADRRGRQRGLWLRGKLTVDPDQALRDYQRLVVEFPGGPHTAGALLRVAQAADARGRITEAARHYDQLLREHPNSPHRLVARRWLDEHAGQVTRARRTAAARDGGPEEEGGEGPSPAEDAPSEAGPPEAAAEASTGPVAVQLGAFTTREHARALAEEARAEGFRVRLVRLEGSDLIRVRAGRFPDRQSARDLRDRVRGTGMQALIVTDARKERPIR